MNSSSAAKWIMIASIAVTGVWIRIPHTIQILLMLMGLDVVSGIIAAVVVKSVNSSVMVRGLFKKLAVFPLLGLLHIVEQPLSLPFEFESIAALAFIVYEAMSIIENCATAGLPIPAVIVSALARAKVRAATPEEIQREFGESNETKLSVSKETEIIKTPDSSPDMKVEKVVTVMEEKHVAPVRDPQGGAK
jgi:toxin secretion/phage lysis holin